MKYLIPNPVNGQKRTIRKFAFLPEEMTDAEGKRYTVWLEFYNVIQQFVEGQEFIVREWKEIKREVRGIKKWP